MRNILAAIVVAGSLAGCSTADHQDALLVGGALIAAAPTIATAACDTLTKQAAHTAKCLSTAGAVITFGKAFVPPPQ